MIHQIIEKIEKLNALQENNKQFQSIMRYNFMQDYLIFLSNSIVGVLLCGAIAIQPYFYEHLQLPMRAKFPYLHVDDKPSSSIYYALIYSFQVLTTHSLIQSIIYMDQTGGSIIKLITIHFEMLVEKFRNLNSIGFDYSLHDLIREHQYLIKYVLYCKFLKYFLCFIKFIFLV